MDKSILNITTIMTEEKIKQYATDCVEEIIKESEPLWSSTLSKPAAEALKGLLISCIIKGAHSRDEEIEQLQGAVNYFMDVASAAEAELLKLRNQWISVADEKPSAVEQKEFGSRRLSKQVLAMYEDGKCHVVRYDYDCQCWRWANSYGQMFQPKMWRYIDVPDMEKL